MLSYDKGTMPYPLYSDWKVMVNCWYTKEEESFGMKKF